MQKLSIPDAEFYYISKVFDSHTSEYLFDSLKTSTQWKQEQLTFYGRKVDIPRLTKYYGSNPYYYSGLKNAPESFSSDVGFVLGAIEGVLFIEHLISSPRYFNSALLNYYRDGKDSISWHSDDETSLGCNPLISSFSLGAERVFKLRNKKTKQEFSIHLESGSLLFMGNNSQTLYEHCLPKLRDAHSIFDVDENSERINITFRKIL